MCCIVSVRRARRQRSSVGCTEPSRPLLERTTPISAHYLRLALRGAFSERLTALLDTVADGPERGALHDSRLDAAIDAVAAVGATSGADALAGVTLTLDVLADPARFVCVKDVA